MTKWIFRQYLGDLIPDDLAETMKAKGMKPPAPVPALDNSGNCSVLEVDEAGEVVGTVALVLPVREAKRGQGHKLEDPERDARAHLIAAAPEMLSMLKWLEEITVYPERNCSCHLSPPCNDCVEYGAIREAMENTRALIAKAEGKS